jgi:hypothetical protein
MKKKRIIIDLNRNVIDKIKNKNHVKILVQFFKLNIFERNSSWIWIKVFENGDIVASVREKDVEKRDSVS